jgi:hypothetical protein
MQTDSFGLSLLWGRVGAAVLVLVGVALGAFGTEFGADTQSEVYGMIALGTKEGGAGMKIAAACPFPPGSWLFVASALRIFGCPQSSALP